MVTTQNAMATGRLCTANMARIIAQRVRGKRGFTTEARRHGEKQKQRQNPRARSWRRSRRRRAGAMWASAQEQPPVWKSSWFAKILPNRSYYDAETRKPWSSVASAISVLLVLPFSVSLCLLLRNKFTFC